MTKIPRDRFKTFQLSFTDNESRLGGAITDKLCYTSERNVTRVRSCVQKTCLTDHIHTLTYTVSKRLK